MFVKGQQVLIDNKQLATVLVAQEVKMANGLKSGKNQCKVIYNTGVSQMSCWIPNNRLTAVTIKAEKKTAEDNQKILEEVNNTPREKTEWVEEPVIDPIVGSNIIKGVNTASAHDQADFQG